MTWCACSVQPWRSYGSLLCPAQLQRGQRDLAAPTFRSTIRVHSSNGADILHTNASAAQTLLVNGAGQSSTEVDDNITPPKLPEWLSRQSLSHDTVADSPPLNKDSINRNDAADSGPLLTPHPELSAIAAVEAQVQALQFNDLPRPDHGVEVLYHFANAEGTLGGSSLPCYFGFPSDLYHFGHFCLKFKTRYKDFVNFSSYEIHDITQKPTRLAQDRLQLPDEDLDSGEAERLFGPTVQPTGPSHGSHVSSSMNLDPRFVGTEAPLFRA
ncbi:hypothetical protein KFL_002660020 [Klebsormidium nitens]|uniref:Uncharacterized protein n=1 Tax=Klebsormidium nitens TaxID=105231 RepID=A0A1Y1IA68_KLENI|nr:hypothetical protein KFL_002660020 [Klebsormidium nitens]|eukprot:GAQ86021.1 hypothetical protein KFL_002660020 [Klebsormidium nitens]